MELFQRIKKLCSYFYGTISKKQLSEGGKKNSKEQDVYKSIVIVLRKIGVGWGAYYTYNGKSLKQNTQQ